MSDILTNNSDNPQLLPITEAASKLGLSERTIWRRIRSGKLHSVEINGRTCVQLLASDSTVTESDNGVTCRAKMTSNAPDIVIDTLKGTIRRLEADNDRLWHKLDEQQQAITDLTKIMLPAPKANKGYPVWALILAVIILAVIGIGGYWLWLTHA